MSRIADKIGKKSKKIILVGPSGCGKTCQGLSIVQKKKSKTVLIGSCVTPNNYEDDFPFLRSYIWDGLCGHTGEKFYTGEKYYFSDLTATHVATKKMNFFCEDCSKDKDATIFYADGTWGENGLPELLKMTHYKCNIIIEAQSLSDVLKMDERDITKDVKTSLSKLGWTIVETYFDVLIFGSSGSGKCHHPWDSLKPCPCGCKERPLLMYEKDKLYFCGGTTENVFAVCSVCGRYTETSDISTTINNWNNGETVDSIMVDDKTTHEEESAEFIIINPEEECKTAAFVGDVLGSLQNHKERNIEE